jgi:hypothetical protein
MSCFGIQMPHINDPMIFFVVKFSQNVKNNTKKYFVTIFPLKKITNSFLKLKTFHKIWTLILIW